MINHKRNYIIPNTNMTDPLDILKSTDNPIDVTFTPGRMEGDSEESTLDEAFTIRDEISRYTAYDNQLQSMDLEREKNTKFEGPFENIFTLPVIESTV